jgi:hypothetical protein
MAATAAKKICRCESVRRTYGWISIAASTFASQNRLEVEASPVLSDRLSKSFQVYDVHIQLNCAFKVPSGEVKCNSEWIDGM